METIKEKYDRVRHLIKDGDVILIHGTALISKLEKICDNAYITHVGGIIEHNGALGVIDAECNGVQWDRLSKRIFSYKPYGDFMILRSTKSLKEISTAQATLLERSDDKWLKYDFGNGAKELINRFCKNHNINFNLKIKLSASEFICSTEIAKFSTDLDMVTNKFKELPIQFPEDYRRYLNTEGCIIVVDVRPSL